MKIKKDNITPPDEETTIKELHEAWALKNGYRENDQLNIKNTTCFKDGAER